MGCLGNGWGPELASGGQVSLVHRLDRETSGALLVATTAQAARYFSRQIERGEMRKQYLAIVFGWPDWEARTMDAPILRGGSRQPFRIWLKEQEIHPDGVAARERTSRWCADFSGTGRKLALLSVRPLTGRMHQIRVHAAGLGHPLVGDKIYGEDEGCYLRFIEAGWTPELAATLLLPRHALHAVSLEFADFDGRPKKATAPLPSDLRKFLGAGANW